jgi:hypothetical protein
MVSVKKRLLTSGRRRRWKCHSLGGTLAMRHWEVHIWDPSVHTRVDWLTKKVAEMHFEATRSEWRSSQGSGEFMVG